MSILGAAQGVRLPFEVIVLRSYVGEVVFVFWQGEDEFDFRFHIDQFE